MGNPSKKKFRKLGQRRILVKKGIFFKKRPPTISGFSQLEFSFWAMFPFGPTNDMMSSLLWIYFKNFLKIFHNKSGQDVREN